MIGIRPVNENHHGVLGGSIFVRGSLGLRIRVRMNSTEATVVAKMILLMFGTAMAFTLLSRKFWAMA